MPHAMKRQGRKSATAPLEGGVPGRAGEDDSVQQRIPYAPECDDGLGWRRRKEVRPEFIVSVAIRLTVHCK
jgi:hypothetical protein